MSMRPCSVCSGARLRKETLSVTIGGMNIGEVSAMSVFESSRFFNTLKLSRMEYDIADQILKEISQRLSFLINVGLSYLTLD